MTTERPLLIVGNDGGTNVGGSLFRAARASDVSAELIDAGAAYRAPRPIARFNWWLRGRLPTRLRSFSEAVAERWRERPPVAVLATGLAPLDARALREAVERKIPTLVFLTDDPWNPAFRSRWFLQALPLYSHVFTARRSNVDDLRRHGCAAVEFMPFGFDPGLFFPDPPPPEEERTYAADVFFAGGADADRRPYVNALLTAGMSLALYGDYWERFPETRGVTRGHATPEQLRHAIAASKVCLGLVRKANRDGHSMRSIEVPAAGGCFLVERTAEHEEIFGPEGDAVAYFESLDGMVQGARRLLSDESLRRRLSARARQIVAEGRFTYQDRLRTILGAVS